MRKPNENLEDYSVKPTTELPGEPKRPVELRSTGEVETVKPLIREEAPATNAYAFRSVARHQPLWFRRLVAVGGGVLVVIAGVLVSAILIGVNDPNDGSDAVTQVEIDQSVTQPEELFTFEIPSPTTFESISAGIDIVRATTKRKVTRARLNHRPQHYLRPLMQIEEPKFVPTTLVIYAEDGVVKTRVEPWIQSS